MITNCPAGFENKLFLTVRDLMNIMPIGEGVAYEFLKNPPFITSKVGTKIMIHAKSFWDWYEHG